MADTVDVDLNQQHRYLRLPHPRTGLPQLYLSYKSSIPGGEGLVEVVKINCAHRRTWFIGETGIDGQYKPQLFTLPPQGIEASSDIDRRVDIDACPGGPTFPRHPNHTLPLGFVERRKPISTIDRPHRPG